ncbi:MAG: histidine phosphatase family protein [Victivallales bacterium]
MVKEIYIVRHAESMENIGIESSVFDPGLSPKGLWQKNKCAEFLKKYCNSRSILLSSPFLRCVITSETIAEAIGTKIRLEPALHEYFSTTLFNIKKVKLPSLKKIASTHPLITGDYPDDKWWPDANEDRAALEMRLALFRNRLLGNEFNSDRIICVGHWASVEALAKSLVPSMDIFSVENTSVIRIDFDGRKCHLVFNNEIPFLVE